MRTPRSLVLLPLATLALAAAHCGGDPDPGVTPQPDIDGGSEASVTPEGGADDKPLVPASKVDLLFVVDDSASMGDKQALLSTSIGRILRRLIDPTSGHAPIGDLHVGVISTSLGNQGGDVCMPSNPRTNDGARLLNKAKNGSPVQGAENGFLAFGPGGITDVAALEKAAADIIVGVDQTGCGLEAQLESMYRFLVQPDPPLSIELDGDNRAKYVGVDYALLAQRRAFLRPDSAVAVVMITDEDDSAVDPLTIGGQGWAFAAKNFPGSMVSRGSQGQGTTAPRGTSACASDPASESCKTCGLLPSPNDPSCQVSGMQGRSGPGYDGYYGPDDDALNVRFHRMKQRFGIDPQFPIDRYVRGLTDRKVPNRGTEHDEAGTYVHAETCTNPLFAAELPAEEGDELCHLPDGPRSRELVFFGLIGGVPGQLVTGSPDWTKILGADPDTYDETGIDPHMIQSLSPRAGLTGADLPRGDNGSDPVHGREWNTMKDDLQYACTFELPAPRTCAPSDSSCDCSAVETGTNPPLCGVQADQQVRGKAYPTPRQLRVAKGLAHRAVVASYPYGRRRRDGTPGAWSAGRAAASALAASAVSRRRSGRRAGSGPLAAPIDPAGGPRGGLAVCDRSGEARRSGT